MLSLIFSIIMSITLPLGLPSTNGLTFTFDDGPTKHTIKILNILKKHNVKAVFCIPAVNLFNKKNRDIVKRAIREGHIMCNHSYSHPRFDRLTKEQQRRQIIRTQRVFKSLLGVTPKYFRPPFGVITRHMRYWLRYYNIKMLYWSTFPSLDSGDWHPKTTPNRIYTRIIRGWLRLRKKGKSGVALFHDTHWRSAYILEKIILRVKKGYKPKKLSY